MQSLVLVFGSRNPPRLCGRDKEESCTGESLIVESSPLHPTPTSSTTLPGPINKVVYLKRSGLLVLLMLFVSVLFLPGAPSPTDRVHFNCCGRHPRKHPSTSTCSYQKRSPLKKEKRKEKENKKSALCTYLKVIINMSRCFLMVLL